ncbi:hypothetical protein BH11BAC5_BH11BAC5_23920 [soil metagenome]
MKKHIEATITGISVFLLSLISKAQDMPTTNIPKVIASYHLLVGYDMTSNLLFPYAVKSVDRGSAHILVQKAKGVENILQVKAAQKGFDQTNLSVVTSDGKFYSFLVDYAAMPGSLNLTFINDTVNAFLSSEPISEAELEKISKLVKIHPDFLHKKMTEQEMWLSLNAIYLSDSLMWFKIRLTNNSQITYLPEDVRFFIRDRKRAKRTARQERELWPVYFQPPAQVNGEQALDFVGGFPPFTIPASQELIIRVGERNGGRMLQLPIHYRTILKARRMKI